jgi:hypothetical protein
MSAATSLAPKRRVRRAAPARTSPWPTRKWLAATVTAVAGILTTLATTGWQFTPAIDGALITLLGQRVVAYLVSNDGGGAATPARS